MGAREDLLAAARALSGRGIAVFSPAQLIAEARANGSTNLDSTLRTFIVGPMCLNSPDNHPVQYGDLERVSRGLYRLVSADQPRGIGIPGEPPSPLPPVDEPEPSKTDDDTDWFWEGNVQATVVGHLAAGGVE